MFVIIVPDFEEDFKREKISPFYHLLQNKRKIALLVKCDAISTFLEGYVKAKYCFYILLIAVEGAKTPAGLAGQVRPRRSKATRRLSAGPAESEASGTKINSLVYKPFVKRLN
ncbi:hypothetical protein [Mesobacillus subterraneus]|uniref:hypothetical protein n=1 Tax=Mesobacillus subterraneus TaxID=285983 RepID=UPI001CFD9AE8|nr:hypothetical protein [Mesobacillus subterraneus]